MRTFLLAVLGALVGGAFEAFQTFELVRTGAYPLSWGMAIVFAGAVVGAALFAGAFAAYRAFASPKNS